MPRESQEDPAVDDLAVALFRSLGYIHCLQATGMCAVLRLSGLSVGLDSLDNKDIPGVIMAGTSSSFFTIPGIRELIRCVEFGGFPYKPTIITEHVPDIPRPDRRFSEGMEPLGKRRAIPQCYEVFKKFLFEC
ncbi:hypothetical protein EDD18DRAFT_1411059 [Armillaria luteobubalina]|uniref:Uncharacterized protein n=1 Tax=Armillaria luteobubalina TaxID=153913 RepID=A0AA39QJX4_9AGAR|nr:hypothetical protein EDD18DRAFT_1411059 [Armillaria luteobubalina]